MDAMSKKQAGFRSAPKSLMVALASSALLLSGFVQATPALAQPAPGGPVDVPAPAPVQEEPFAVTITRTDKLGDTVKEGDVLTYTIRVENKTGKLITAFPRSSNLNGVLTTGAPNCRWGDLPIGMAYDCTSASYRVTKDDATKKSFTPEVTFDASSDRDGKQVVTKGSKVTGPTVAVAEGKDTDPAATPKDRVDGSELVLGKDFDAGFRCHRIPALTTAPNGWLLAAWDGRPDSCGDAPQANSIIQRISKDGGRSWEPIKVVAAGKKESPKFGYSDPSYVVDRETGHIFMFFVKSFDQSFQGSQAGVDPNARNVLHAAVTKSTDNGQTWEEPVVITKDITTDPATWISRFAASGEGIQKQYAPNKGRLVQQFTIKTGNTPYHYQALSVYSDDHGKTWKAGQPVGHYMDENKVVELENGDLMLNSRTSSSQTIRKVAISKDGGQTYGEVRDQEDLIDPRNNAAIIRAFPDAAPGSFDSKILLFTNAKSRSARANGHVSVSFDNGQTWSISKNFDVDGMAYSTITHLRDEKGKVIPGKYGILYEEPYNAIKYMPISWDWLNLARVEVSGVDREAQRGVLKFSFKLTNHDTAPIEKGTFTPDAIPGWEWKTQSIDVPRIEPGQTVTVEAVAKVGNSQAEGPQKVSGVFSASGKGESKGGLTATFKLVGDQKPSGCLRADAIKIANEQALPAQSGEEIARTLDGKEGTMWHTPYGSTVPLPLDIDVAFKYQSGISSLDLIRRALGSDNGVFNEVSLHLVKDGKETELVAKGAVPADGRYALDALKGQVKDGEDVTVRVKVHSTKGDTPNKWASLAELCVLSVDTSVSDYDETKDPTPPVPNPPGQNPPAPNPPAPPVVPGPVPNPPAPSPGPSTNPGVNTQIARISGETRVETAIQIANNDFKDGAETIVLARADIPSDSITSVPYADAIGAPILLTQPDSLHPAVVEAITRLKAKRVIIMGGEVAINTSVEDALKKAGLDTHRVGGKNRAETAMYLAFKLAGLGRLDRVLITNGNDWQTTLVAGPAAANVKGAILYTNGDKNSPETELFLRNMPGLEHFTIGNVAAKVVPQAKPIVGLSTSALGVAVAQEFFQKPKAVGFATTEDFADGLTGGAHIARMDGPLILLPQQTPTLVSEWFKGAASITQVFVYGGEGRITSAQIEDLTK